MPQWGELLWFWLWSISGAVLVWRIRHPLILGVSLIVTSTGLVGVCWLSFVSAIWIPITPAILGLLSTTGAILAFKTFHSASIDELTGLANREQAIALLQQKISKPRQSTVAVMAFDIPRLKKINDSLGKSINDRLLILATIRIKNCIRTEDRLARVGLAEFSTMLFSIADQDYALEVGQRIQQ